MTVHLDVTAALIRRGTRDARYCPVALALREAVPGYDLCMAGPLVLHVRLGNGRWLSGPTPPAVGDWLKHFDAGESVGPIAFDVTLAEEAS